MITKKLLPFAALTFAALPCTQAAVLSFSDSFVVGTQVNGTPAKDSLEADGYVVTGVDPSNTDWGISAVVNGGIFGGGNDLTIVRTFVGAVNIGDEFTLTGFDASDSGRSGGTFDILIDGASVASTAITGSSFGDQVTFTALSAGTTFGFEINLTGISGGGSSDFVRVSDVTFDAVPEPSSAALLGLAGLALILRRRK